jgi:ribosomal-protein-alanine N-acetyltransferase
MLKTQFEAFPVLETERLVLRQLSMQDENEIFLLRSDAVVNRYVDRERAQSIEDARIFIRRILDSLQKQEVLHWVLSLKTQPRLVGTIGLWNFNPLTQKAEVGYEMLPSFHGKGLMQEALAKVLWFGFEKMNLQSIEACVHPGNLSSLKLLQKYGFALQEGRDDIGENEMMYLLNSKVYKKTGLAI